MNHSSLTTSDSLLVNLVPITLSATIANSTTQPVSNKIPNGEPRRRKYINKPNSSGSTTRLNSSPSNISNSKHHPRNNNMLTNLNSTGNSPPNIDSSAIQPPSTSRTCRRCSNSLLSPSSLTQTSLTIISSYNTSSLSLIGSNQIKSKHFLILSLIG